MSSPNDINSITTMHEAKLREELKLPDAWEMRDLPWMKAKLWAEFIEILGPDNVKIVSATERTIKGDEVVYVRGTVFISQEGKNNLKAYAERVET
jgi:hypothetical protein